MNMTYDREADAAYLASGKDIEPGEAAQQVGLIDMPNGQTQVIIDVSRGGYLLGMEILFASVEFTGTTFLNKRISCDICLHPPPHHDKQAESRKFLLKKFSKPT